MIEILVQLIIKKDQFLKIIYLYSIANLNSEEIPFEIDDFTGQIKSKRRLDYESDRRVYHLKIRASDWGTPYR